MHPWYETHVASATRRTARLAPLAALCAFAAAIATGCAGYTNWPGEPLTANSDPSARPNDAVIVSALRWTVNRYPVDDRYALNLPQGLDGPLYQLLVERVSPNAEPVLPGNQDLPTYHVKEIQVRGRTAEVLVLRPATELGRRPNGDYPLQPVTVGLRGDFSGWRVTRAREWTAGIESPPALHVLGSDPQTPSAPPTRVAAETPPDPDPPTHEPATETPPASTPTRSGVVEITEVTPDDARQSTGMTKVVDEEDETAPGATTAPDPSETEPETEIVEVIEITDPEG